MEKGKRMQVTLAPFIAEKLDRYCEERGVKRSAVIALALSKLWEEESGTDKK